MISLNLRHAENVELIVLALGLVWALHASKSLPSPAYKGSRTTAVILRVLYLLVAGTNALRRAVTSLP